jgi:hypothetical protein
LRAIVNLSEWERDAQRYSVICADGTEYGAIGISRLRQLYEAGTIQSTSPVFDAVDNRWVPLGDRFNTGAWCQWPASADGGTTSDREPEVRAAPEEEATATTASAREAEPLDQQGSEPDLRPALQAIEEDGTRKYWASWLLFASSALELTWYVFAKSEGFLLLNEGMTTGTLLWNVIVAFGLSRGGDGWRTFACVRAGLGLLLGFGYAVEGRSGTYYGWLNALWCIGFLVLLCGKATSRRRIIGTTLVAGGQVAVFAYLLVGTILPEYRVRWQIQAYSELTSKVADENLGYTVNIPSGWTVLKKDNPILKLPDAKVVAVNVRNGAFVAFLAEPAFADLRSPDDYLDQIEKTFTTGTSSQFRELRRTNTMLDGTIGRRAEALWQEAGEEYHGVFLVVRRGWFYYSLRGWSAKAFRSKAEASFSEMQAAVKISADPSDKFTDGFLKGLRSNNPLISQETGRRLVEAAMARSYTMMDIRQLIETAVEKGRPGLTRVEQGELDALYARAFTTLPDQEYRNLLSYYDKVNAGQKTDPTEAQTAEKLVLKGVRNLPESVQIRFQAIFSKMVEQGLARID